MRIQNFKGSIRVLLPGILVCVFLCTSNAYAQDEEPVSSELKEYKGMIESFFDPSFPKENRSGDKMGSEIHYIQAMRAYAQSVPDFPVYVNTGNRESDLRNYEAAIDSWFEENPYFPRYIDTGHPEQDKERFEKIRREWIYRFPQQYRELYELVISDNELMSEYLFVIQ